MCLLFLNCRACFHCLCNSFLYIVHKALPNHLVVLDDEMKYDTLHHGGGLPSASTRHMPIHNRHDGSF